MRLAFLTSHLSAAATGVGSAVAGLATAVARQGWCEVHVVGTRDPQAPDDWRGWQAAGVEVHALAQWGPRSFGAAPGLQTTLQALKLDLIHCHGLWSYSSYACLRWRRRTARPYLVTPHGMLDAWALRRSRLKKHLAARWFASDYLKEAACLHALNQAEAQAIRAYGLRNPICIVPNGVELPVLMPGGRAATRHAPGAARELLFLGRIDSKKGVRELLQAWSLVAGEAARSGWRLKLTGRGMPAYEQAMRALAASLGLEASVTFTGPLYGEAKDAALRAATAFILPSFSEGMPLAVLEAWSYRLPVIMSAECNLPDGPLAGAALEVQVEPDAIAAGLRRLFRLSEEELARMGAAGRGLVESHYTWDQAGHAMTAVYRWLAGGCRPAGILVD